MSRIGDKIKNARIGKGFTQKELAKKCGISESYIVEVETGKKVVGESLIKRISAVLGVDISESVYAEEDTAIPEKEAAKPAAKKAPLPEWQSAFSSIIKDIPVFDINMEAAGVKRLPIIDKKVEGYNPEKLLYLIIPDNSLSGFRIKKGDRVMVVLGGEPSNGFYLMEYDGIRMVRNIKLMGANKVLLMSSDNELKADTRDLREIKLLGRCVRVEADL